MRRGGRIVSGRLRGPNELRCEWGWQRSHLSPSGVEYDPYLLWNAPYLRDDIKRLRDMLRWFERTGSMVVRNRMHRLLMARSLVDRRRLACCLGIAMSLEGRPLL